MSQGSPRITLRLPADLKLHLDAAVQKRNEGNVSPIRWTRTRFIMQAIIDKLNHDRRSAGRPGKFQLGEQFDGFATEFWEKIQEL